jgi:hypothetical protein
MKLKKNIAASESGFIFNPTSGDSFSTNEIGAKLLMYLQEGKTYSSIKDSILEEYDINETVFERDWMDFVSQLKDYKLIEV